MTAKQQKLAQGIAEGKHRVDAARDAGYKFPEVSAYNALDSATAQEHLNRLMDKQGLSEQKLLKPLKDGLAANRVISAGEGTIETPDHAIRLKSSEIGWKLRGKLLNQNNQNFAGPTQIVTVHNYRPQPIETNGSPAN